MFFFKVLNVKKIESIKNCGNSTSKTYLETHQK